MMSRNTFKLQKILLTLAFSAIIAGCVRARPFEPPPGTNVTRLRWSQSGQLVRIHESGMLAVHLACPRSRDGKWRLSRPSDKGILRLAGVRHTGEERLPCARKHEVIFYFSAVAPGVTSFAIEVTEPVKNEPSSFELAVEVYY